MPPAGFAGRMAPPGAEERSELHTVRRAFVLVLLAVFGYFSMLVFEPFVSYLFMGGLFVYLLHPLYRRILRWVRRPPIAAGIVLVFFILALLGPLGWVTVQVVQTARTTVEQFDAEAALAAADMFLVQFYDLVGIEHEEGRGAAYELLSAALPDLQQRLQAQVPGLLTFAGALTLGLLVMAFTLYYGLIDGARFVRYVKSAMPLEAHQANALIEEVRRTVDAVFLGHIIVSAIQGIIGGIGFLLFGVPNAVFWGFVMILLALIPVIGPPVIWIPAVLYLLLTGHVLPALGLLVWSVLLVSTLDNLIRPRIVGNYADIHPLLILVGVLGGILAFGFIGFVLGPLVIAVLVALVNFWRTDYLPQVSAPAGPPPPRPGDTPGLPPP